MKLPSKQIEKRLFKSGYDLIIGVDEVGVGALAGPAVVCAVAVTNNFYNKNHRKLYRLRDSKLLQTKHREKFAEQLKKEKDFSFVVASSSNKEIDRLNIYQATRKAMQKAIGRLETNFPLRKIALVDGNTKIKGLEIDQTAIVKGDRKVFAIACASIIAKVFRDKLMAKYAVKFPGYGFEKHKGYGTEYHQNRLLKLGPCKIHRKSFAPVARLL